MRELHAIRVTLSCLLGAVWTFAATGQTYRCPDLNGRAAFSNLPCDSTQRVIPMGTASNVRGVAALLSMMDAAAVEKDAVKRGPLVHAVHQGVAAYKAQSFSAAVAQAEEKSGVSELARQLRDAEARDRADPLWEQFKSDSPITAAVRERLATARELANKLAPRQLELNADYARVMVRYATFEKNN